MQQEPFIIEYYKVGNLLKVSAIDPISKKEVCVFGSSATSKEFITSLAVQKLQYQLNRKVITPQAHQE